jgi:hypothetical protein
MKLKSLALLGLLVLFAWAKPASAESYHSCTNFISALPATITGPGVWCMLTDLSSSSTSATLITVNANNVTIDCNGHALISTGGLGNTATGIYAYFRNNTTVRNCHIRGLKSGVWLVGNTGKGNVVEDNVFDGNTYTALVMNGDGSVARRNQVLNTGGSTVYATVYGIYSYNAVDLIDNTVSGVTARTSGGGSAYGIYTNNNGNNTVTGNRVRGVTRDGAGTAYGVFIYGIGRQSVRDNDVLGNGAVGSVGLYCSTNSTHVQDNRIFGFAYGISGGCAQDAGNVVDPP